MIVGETHTTRAAYTSAGPLLLSLESTHTASPSCSLQSLSGVGAGEGGVAKMFLAVVRGGVAGGMGAAACRSFRRTQPLPMGLRGGEGFPLRACTLLFRALRERYARRDATLLAPCRGSVRTHHPPVRKQTLCPPP